MTVDQFWDDGEISHAELVSASFDEIPNQVWDDGEISHAELVSASLMRSRIKFGMTVNDI